MMPLRTLHHWATSNPYGRSDWHAGTSDPERRPELSSGQCRRHRTYKPCDACLNGFISASMATSECSLFAHVMFQRGGRCARLVPAESAAAGLLQGPVQVASLCKMADDLVTVRYTP